MYELIRSELNQGGQHMNKISMDKLNQLEMELLNSDQAKEIAVELAQEYMLADLFSGTYPKG